MEMHTTTTTTTTTTNLQQQDPIQGKSTYSETTSSTRTCVEDV